MIFFVVIKNQPRAPLELIVILGICEAMAD
jgi:hypothetical protein